MSAFDTAPEWLDIGNSGRDINYKEVERRPYSSAPGVSRTMRIGCPFCSEETLTKHAALDHNTARCDTCRAVFDGIGGAYHWANQRYCK